MKTKKSDREMMFRIVDAAFLDYCWKDAEAYYGKKATQKLRSVAPADPFLLRDMAISSYMDIGKTKKEAKELIEAYTDDDWFYDVERFAKTINKVKNLYAKEILDKYNKKSPYERFNA